jgi:hypothetical protein
LRRFALESAKLGRRPSADDRRQNAKGQPEGRPGWKGELKGLAFGAGPFPHENINFASGFSRLQLNRRIQSG